jgi:hypothetical protein
MKKSFILCLQLVTVNIRFKSKYKRMAQNFTYLRQVDSMLKDILGGVQ